jgi:mono/diheme cytochrome c family protein
LKAARTSIAMAFACAALAASAEAPQGDAARGKALFMKDMCYTCHGTAGQGGDRGSGPRLTPGLFPWEGFQVQVRHPRSVMPRYAREFVSDQDLADIYAYLASMKPGPSAKDIPLLRE